MVFQSCAALLLVLILAYPTAGHNLDYSDIEEIGASCNPRDTCSTGGQRLFMNTNCECDSQCQLYKDCCIDATVTRSVTPLIGITCLPDGFPRRGVYAVTKCQSGWRGPAQVRQRCESLDDISDPLVAAPVTDIQNSVTYKNRYCAECNGADPSHLQSWIITVGCDSLKGMNSTGNITGDYVSQKLSFKTTYPNRNKWGIYYWNNEAQHETFYPCELTFMLPEYLTEFVRFCRPDVISTCPSNWRQKSVRKNCKAYMAVVYIDSAAYRNPHCALCHGKDLGNIVCSLGILSRSKPPMSFTLLLDVNLSDGNRVGEINRCPEGQMYDSFFKKCRNLVCALPGYRLEGERCVQG